MALSGWLRGLVAGAALLFVALLLPTTWLDGPAAAVGQEAGAFRMWLAIVLFVAGYVLGTRLFTQRDWEFDAADDTPLPVSQPAVGPAVAAGPRDLDERLERIERAIATLPAQTTKAIKTSPSADLDRTLRSIQRALRKPHSDPVLVEAVHALQQDGPASLLARIEALEGRMAEQLAAIDARLAMLQLGEREPAPLALPHLPMRRPTGDVAKRIGRAVADIRRSIDSVPH